MLHVGSSLGVGRLGSDPTVVLHERGAGPRIAKEDDLLVFELQPRLAGAPAMVDECEDGQSAALDPRYQRGHRRSKSEYASVSDHVVSSDELSEEDVRDRDRAAKDLVTWAL
jgi:hypothetical protein